MRFIILLLLSLSPLALAENAGAEIVFREIRDMPLETRFIVLHDILRSDTTAARKQSARAVVRVLLGGMEGIRKLLKLGEEHVLDPRDYINACAMKLAHLRLEKGIQFLNDRLQDMTSHREQIFFLQSHLSSQVEETSALPEAARELLLAKVGGEAKARLILNLTPEEPLTNHQIVNLAHQGLQCSDGARHLLEDDR